MSSPKTKAVWFLPRTRSRPPEAALTMGALIASPSYPEEVINIDPPPSIPSHLLRTSCEPAWSWSKEFKLSRSGGVFASFLQVSGLGGDLDFSADSARKEIYTADSLVTEYFIPDKAFIEASLQDEDVQNALAGPNRKKRLYMITGVKTARGATTAVDTMKKKSMHAQLGVDFTSLGAPVTIGPTGGVDYKVKEHSSAGKSNFVFAFQLREIVRKKGGKVEHNPFDKGALYGVGPEPPADDTVSEGELKADDLDVADASASSDAFTGIDRRTVLSEIGEELDIIILP